MIKKEYKIHKAFETLKQYTNLFTYDGKWYAYIGTDEQCKVMLEQFDSVKPVLFYTINNKGLIIDCLAKHKDSQLEQLVSILLGYQGQKAYDNNDEVLEMKLHIETCIWQSIILNAKYRTVN